MLFFICRWKFFASLCDTWNISVVRCHYLFTSSCIKSTSFQSWIDQRLKHDRFHSLGKSPEVCFWSPLCTRVVLSSVVSFSHREDTKFGSSAGYAEMLGTIQCCSFISCSCWISPHLVRSFWTDLIFGMSLRLPKWNLYSMRGYSLRMCVPKGTGFVGCYCRLTSKLLRPWAPGPQL